MSLSISNANNNVNNIQVASRAVQKTSQQLSSGSRYNSAGDNASAYAILTRMYSNIDTLSQSNENTQTMNSLLSTAGGAVDSTVSSLSSLQEKLLQAANGTNTASDRSMIQQEVNQTISQIDENAGVTYNGKNLLSGDTTLAVASDTGYQNVSLSNMTAQGLGLADADGNSTLDLSTPSGIQNALDTVSAALDTALSQQTTIGATQQGLGYASSNYTTANENMTAAASTMGDTNIAAQITKLKSSQSLEQMAVMATKLNMHRNGDVLALLR